MCRGWGRSRFAVRGRGRGSRLRRGRHPDRVSVSGYCNSKSVGVKQKELQK